MSKFILSAKTIGVFADGRFYAGAYPGTPGEGESSLLLTAKSHFSAEEWDQICSDLCLGNISPAEASELFTDEECTALAWAITPKPWKCSPSEAEIIRTYVSTEAEYGNAQKSNLTPQGSEVEAAKTFKSLLGRMPSKVIATLAFRQGEVISTKGRTYTRPAQKTGVGDPTAILSTRMRFLSDIQIKAAVTAAGIDVEDTASVDDIKKLALSNAAEVLQKLG